MDLGSSELPALKKELAELAASMKPKHLQIAKALVDGKTQEAAYVEAGYKGKNPNSDANNVITSNPSISKYVDLVKEIAALAALPKQIATFEQKVNILWRIANHDAEIVTGENEDGADLRLRDSRSAIAAIAELNKMQGDLATIKTENKNSHTVELTEAQLDDRIAELSRKT